MITVILYKSQALHGVYPITIMSSGLSNKWGPDNKLITEIDTFLNDQFEYVCYDEENKQDVATHDLNKYVADMVNDALSNIDADDLDDLGRGRGYAKPTSYSCDDFVNEMRVLYGNVYMPGEEVETLSAMFKLYFTGKAINLVER